MDPSPQRRGTPVTHDGFFKLLQQAAAESRCLGCASPPGLHHVTGFKLVNQGFDTLSLAAYLGHRQAANRTQRSVVASRVMQAGTKP
jgi:site-specific recombinase XerD